MSMFFPLSSIFNVSNNFSAQFDSNWPSSPTTSGLTPVKLWNCTWGGSEADMGYGVALDSSDNVYVAGYTENFGAIGTDICLVKFNTTGGVEWNRTWSGSEFDGGYGVALDSSGNTYVSGTTFRYKTNSYDICLIKFNSTGVEWNRTWGGSEHDFGQGIALDSAGNAYIAGYTHSFGAAGSDICLVKFNTTGGVEWNYTWSGIGYDCGYGIALDSSENAYIAGYTHNLDDGSDDIVLVKFNSTGVEWNCIWGGHENEHGHGVALDSSGNAYITGYTNSFGASNWDMCLAKFNTTGGVEWNYTWGGNGVDYGYGITLDSSENVYVAGFTSSFTGATGTDICLVKFNTTGGVEWNFTWGGYGLDQGVNPAIDSEGNVYVAGHTESFGAGKRDMCLVKFGVITPPESLIPFNGLYLNYSFSSQVFGSGPSELKYSQISTNLFHAVGDSELWTSWWDINSYTRMITNCGGDFTLNEGTHTPIWIFTEINIGDDILISVDGEGDHTFKVSKELNYTLSGYGNVEAWQLDDMSLPGGFAIYEKNTGILLNSTFCYYGGVYNYSLILNNSNAFMYFSFENVNISFMVEYNNLEYNVSLSVPLVKYLKSTEKVDNFIDKYPDIDRKLLEKAYYLYCYIRDPIDYPILKAMVYHNGDPIQDKPLKIEIIRRLLIYCQVLRGAASTTFLEMYSDFSENWKQEYEDDALKVKLTDIAAKVLYYTSLILPILNMIKNLFGDWTADIVKGVITFIEKAITGGFEGLVESYGEVKAISIVDILQNRGFISSQNYNPIELYGNIVENPSLFMETIDQIDQEVLNFNINYDARSVITNFLDNLVKGFLGGLIKGFSVALIAFFGKGLTLATAGLIGATTFAGSFFLFAAPMALAAFFYEAYAQPMSYLYHCHWEAMKFESDFYKKLYTYGSDIANPQNGILNLTNAEIFSALYGLLKVNEHYMYSLEYYIHSKELLKVYTEVELQKLYQYSMTALSHANRWRYVLGNISLYAETIVDELDPTGINFNFTLSPVVNYFPQIPVNSSGFIVLIESMSGIDLISQNYLFSVDEGMWFSNFSYSFYINDENNFSYLIIFIPASGQYELKLESQKLATLINFEPFGDSFTLLTMINTTTDSLQFTVSESQIDEIREPPEEVAIPGFEILILIGFFGLISIFLIKKRINNLIGDTS